MVSRRAVVCAVLMLLAVPAVHGTGETVGGFPSWEERVIQQLMNRARSAPATDLAGCGGNCSAAELAPGCYLPLAPLPMSFGLNKAARFHSASMGRDSFFDHTTPFMVRSDINAVYPASCDGSAACASSGAGITSTGARIALFGVSFSGEIIAAGYGTPRSAFYGWLWENAPAAPCGFTSPNGHRYLILTGGPSVGTGYASVPGSPYTRYYTGDFGSGGTSSKIRSGTHWGAAGSTAPDQRQSSSIEFWANWYGTAAPLQATVVVDNVSYVMSLGRGSSTNGAWTTTRGGLSTGCHRYYFLLTDSSGTAVRYPTTGTLGIGDSTCADWALGSSPRADFNADFMSDVIWRKSTTGENAMWLMSGVNIISPVLLPTVSDPNWKMAGVGDFDGDGKADVIWSHNVTGQVVVWLMDGTSRRSGTVVGTVASTWKIAGVGDVNNNGKSDVFWRNQITGETAIWLMDGASLSSAASLPTVADLNYNIAGVGDFNADGRTDVFWRHGVTGQNVVWLMGASSVTSALLTNTVADTNYKVVGIGDADADGRADVVWCNQATGDVVVWLMNGGSLASAAFVTTVSDVNWHVEAVGDFDMDQKVDLMWRKVTTGETVVWLMNIFALKQASFVTQVSDLNWSIVAPR